MSYTDSFKKYRKLIKTLTFCKNWSKCVLHVLEQKKFSETTLIYKRELTSFESSSFPFGDSRLQPLNSLCKATHIMEYLGVKSPDRVFELRFKMKNSYRLLHPQKNHLCLPHQRRVRPPSFFFARGFSGQYACFVSDTVKYFGIAGSV